MARRLPAGVALVARFSVSAVLLLLVARSLDVASVVARLGTLSAPWVALGLAVSVLQVVVLGWRWSFTAARLGIELPVRAAVGEYYLGILLNQILPGGVSGDVSRAWRHARTPAPAGAAIRAVALERLSGQAIMSTVAVVSLLALPIGSGGLRVGLAVLVLVGAGVLLLTSVRRTTTDPEGATPAHGPEDDMPADSPPGVASGDSLAGRVWADTRAALLVREALPFQLSTGTLVVVSYIGMYVIAARAVGVDTETMRLLPLIAPVLMTMLLPITVAGWGIRESAAAALWSMVGLTPEDGVAIAVAYGLLVLVSSAPGLPALMKLLIGGRDRRGRHDPEGTSGTPVAAPRPGSRSDRG